MRKPSKRVVVIGAIAVLAAVGVAGGAIAASGTFDPKAEKQAFLNDAAGRLGVTSDKLEAALKAAAIDRVDAALAAGQITKAEADAMKAAINSGRLPLGLGVPFGPRLHAEGHVFIGGDVIDAAATYLGLTQDQLGTQLASGKSLADVAKAQGKTVDGLEQAMTSAFQSKLDQAVKDGRLTSAQRDQILSGFKAHLDDFVNGKLPPRPALGTRDGFHPFGFGLAPRFRIMPGAFHAPAFRYGAPGIALPPTA
jgi:hypothetical protein